jgi:hypothetical protein
MTNDPDDNQPGSDIHPPVTIGGKPLLFVTCEASAVTPNSYPLAAAWTTGPSALVTHRLIKPISDWTDRAWDYDAQQRHGIDQRHLFDHGVPGTRVAEELGTLLETHIAISVVVGLERQWLGELMLLLPEDTRIQTLSLIDLVLAIGTHTGVDDQTLALHAAGKWARALQDVAAAERVARWAKLVQATLDVAVLLKRIDARKTIDLPATLLRRTHKGERS